MATNVMIRTVNLDPVPHWVVCWGNGKFKDSICYGPFAEYEAARALVSRLDATGEGEARVFAVHASECAEDDNSCVAQCAFGSGQLPRR